jgi:Zn-finger nucleic acid-binding protein
LLRCPSVDVSFHSSSGNNVDCNCIGRCKGKA